MAEIINLRTARKRQQRRDKASKAAENRFRYGRTKAEKAAGKLRANRESDALDGHKLTDNSEENA